MQRSMCRCKSQTQLGSERVLQYVCISNLARNKEYVVQYVQMCISILARNRQCSAACRTVNLKPSQEQRLKCSMQNCASQTQLGAECSAVCLDEHLNPSQEQRVKCSMQNQESQTYPGAENVLQQLGLLAYNMSGCLCCFQHKNGGQNGSH